MGGVLSSLKVREGTIMTGHIHDLPPAETAQNREGLILESAEIVTAAERSETKLAVDEDRAVRNDEYGIYGGIDGMGASGMPGAGRVAAELLQDVIPQYLIDHDAEFADFDPTNPETVAGIMKRAFRYGEEKVVDRVYEDPNLFRMGAVLAIGKVFAHKNQAYVLIGVAGDVVARVTDDQGNVKWQSKEENMPPPNEHMVKNAISQGSPLYICEPALVITNRYDDGDVEYGYESENSGQFVVLPLSKGDRFAIYSDGIAGKKSETKLQPSVLQQAMSQPSAQGCAQFLYAASLGRKNEDDDRVVVAVTYSGIAA